MIAPRDLAYYSKATKKEKSYMTTKNKIESPIKINRRQQMQEQLDSLIAKLVDLEDIVSDYAFKRKYAYQQCEPCELVAREIARRMEETKDPEWGVNEYVTCMRLGIFMDVLCDELSKDHSNREREIKIATALTA